MILAGDIGGTNTRLACFDDQHGHLRPVVVEIYPSQRHDRLESIIERFVADHNPAVDGACFGIAGPVRNGVCKTPNLPWVVDQKNITKLLRLEQVRLINDLEANAHGLSVLEGDDLVVLNAGREDVTGNAALISAGTGLGQAGLYRAGDHLLPFASEGGHVDFAPRNDQEIRLLSFLQQSYGGHVSYERVLSGPGLLNIHRFLVTVEGGDEPSWLKQQLQEGDGGRAITEAALAGRSPSCVRAMEIFISLYGSEAGNLALKFLATGGVFVGGGIAPRIIEKLKEPAFLTAFCGKGRMAELLQRIPVKVIVNDKTALLGAARAAWLGLQGL